MHLIQPIIDGIIIVLQAFAGVIYLFAKAVLGIFGIQI